MKTFDQMGLIDPLLKALQHEGYTTPTPIQAQAIPHLLEGRDLLGCAQTGTGKTAAFSLPILQYLHQQPAKASHKKQIRALILTPTRELAIQIEESLRAYGRNLPLQHLVIFGGVGQQPQVNALQRGVDILVATPGRLLDLMQQGFVSLHQLEVFVLDEADRMLDMGFIHDVKRVITKLPEKRQSLFFSATMPPDIQALANTILTNPVKVEVTPASSTADTIEQFIYNVSKKDKPALLQHLLKQHAEIKSVLVFTRTKHGADRVVKDLMRAGETAAAIHGNKSQNARQLALQNFKKGVIRVLVATDIAARGIDIDDLGHVINFELPNIPESYVHRIGRTGRAGASGVAFSFCEAEERAYLKDIQKLIGKQIPVVQDHPFVGNANAVHVKAEQPRQQHQQRRQQQPARNQQQGQRQQQQRPPRPQQQQPAAAQQEKPVAAQQAPVQKPKQQHQRPQPRPAQQPMAGNGQAQQGHAQPPARKFKKPTGALTMPPKKEVVKDDFNSKHVAPVTPLFNDDDRW
ncbi:DEAD/DEAH box helicase [Phnomibacter ginsenosidimutans]|uniref:DEAD-box ATP-dependent RNA helicase RhpA n=1 Tax=Phnomibacter ginsenosidimutans TaxID=2676868 RepID=A0A6I6G2G4_9BACT|nr:DEAD/DEAH box helicase [Phnomibacter ginsenosidimutans]QGW26796.1 DEAD/DEAH box helicase [Phnomibacter ginsenosidimutans]